ASRARRPGPTSPSSSGSPRRSGLEPGGIRSWSGTPHSGQPTGDPGPGGPFNPTRRPLDGASADPAEWTHTTTYVPGPGVQGEVWRMLPAAGTIAPPVVGRG